MAVAQLTVMPIAVLTTVVLVLVLVPGHGSDPTSRSLRCGSVILDGHNDLAQRALDGARPVHIDLAAAAEVDWAGGFFALGGPFPALELPATPAFALPPFAPLDPDEARAAVEQMATALEGLDVTIVRRRAEILPGRVNAIMHLEGAEPLAPDLSDLEAWYERGLRSIGVTWSRPNAFGEGVAFRFPSSPDTGAGLTAAGTRPRPRLQPHRHPRRRLAPERGGLLGRRPDQPGAARRHPLERARALAVLAQPHRPPARRDRRLGRRRRRQLRHGVSRQRGRHARAGHPGRDRAPRSTTSPERIGIDHVAFGSDFEGAEVPAELGGIAGLPRLVEAIRAAGYGEEEIAKITHGNWLRVLDETWRPWSRYFRAAGLDAAPDAPRRGRSLPGARARGRPRSRHRPRHARAPAPRLARLRDRHGDRGDRPDRRARRGRRATASRPGSAASRRSTGPLRPRQRELRAAVLRRAGRSRPSGSGSSPRSARVDDSAGSSSAIDDEWARTGLLVYTPRRGRAAALLRSRSRA